MAISIHTPTKGVTTLTGGQYKIPPDFNPHSHEGSDQQIHAVGIRHKYFNPHSHEGSDPSGRIHLYCTVISIHTPTKGVTGNPFCNNIWHQISIHTPTKGVTTAPCSFPAFSKISIHTPTKGVTENIPDVGTITPISIHTPTKGVTPALSKRRVLSFNFNPHSHEGSDSHARQSNHKAKSISIHTPTKGVT